MLDTLEQIGTFNRVRWPDGAHNEEGCHWIGKMVEWYFDYGQTSYNILQEECDDGIPTEKHEAKRSLGRTILKVIGCALKALSLLTLVIPLVMLIGKAFYRADNIFVVKPKSKLDQDQTPISGDKTDTPSVVNPPVVSTPDGNDNVGGKSSTDSDDDVVVGGGDLPDLTTSPSNGGNSLTNEGVKKAQPKKTPGQLSREFLLSTLLSDPTLQGRINEYETEIDDLSVQTFDDLERVRVLYTQIDDQIVRIQRVLQRERNLEVDKQQSFDQSIKDFRAVLEKLKNKLNSDPHILQIVKTLETEVQERPNDQNLNNYVKAVGIVRKLIDIEENEEPYHVPTYEQAKASIQPTPIENCGNSCYMNSDLQLLLSIPAIKELILGDWKQIPVREQEDDETDEDYQLLCQNKLREFNLTKEYLQHVKPALVAFVAAVESKNQSEINEAAETLRDVTYNVGRTNVKDGEAAFIKMIEDSINGKCEQMQPEVFINTLLNAAGYALRTRRHAFADDDGKEELKVCSEEIAETMITLSLKASVDDEKPYAHTLQGLVDHQFSPMTLDDDWVIDDKPVKKDVTLLQEAPEYLFIQVKRFATEGNVRDGFHKYKLSDPIILDNGELIDFSKAMDKPVTDQDDGPFLYEVVGMVEHHGSIHGGHYTATVKKGGEWQRCNDSSVGMSGDHPQNMENGYLYAFRRIPKGTQVAG